MPGTRAPATAEDFDDHAVIAGRRIHVAERDRGRGVEAVPDDPFGNGVAESPDDGVEGTRRRRHAGSDRGWRARVEDRPIGHRHRDRTVAALVEGDVLFMEHATDRRLDRGDGGRER